MSRNIPPALLAHLQQNVTTTCRLLRITLNDGRVFGLTTLDREVEYLGVTYSAVNGFDPSITATDTGLSVDNAEAYALLSADVPGITVEMVAAGELDDAQWQMMLINWADLSMGHMIIDAGDVGEVNTEDGVVFMPELLSYAMRWNSTQSLTDTTLTAEQVKTSGWNPVAFAISQTPLPSEIHISRGF